MRAGTVRRVLSHGTLPNDAQMGAMTVFLRVGREAGNMRSLRRKGLSL